MKLSSWTIFFTGVLFIMALPMFIDQSKKKEAENEKFVYKNAMESAVQDAAAILMNPTQSNAVDVMASGYNLSEKRVEPNLDAALDQFYRTLFINMNIQNKSYQEAFKAYIPIKLVMAYDGYYINAKTKANIDGDEKNIEMWQPKKYYSYYDEINGLIINFTLDDYVSIYDNYSAETKEGIRKDMEKAYPYCEVLKEENFEKFRLQIIVDKIQKDIEFYVGKNNPIAHNHNWAYKFNIPAVKDHAKFNTMDNVSFFAFVQGLPESFTETYSTYGSSTTKVSKKEKYFGNVINGIKYYHTENCSKNVNSDVIFNSKQQAASQGYYPCNDCK